VLKKLLSRKQPSGATAKAGSPISAGKLPSVEMLDGQPGEITSVQEVAHLLRSVRDEQSLALISLPDGSVSGVATVLEVGLQADILVFAGLTDEASTQALLQTRDPIVVSTSAGQVFVTFDVLGMEVTQHFGRPALKTRLPRSATYMQRRDSFRINIPAAKEVSCTIMEGSTPIHLTAGRLMVRDLSVAGLALIDTGRLLDPMAGKVYGGLLEIPRVGEFEVTLSTVHSIDEESGIKGVGKMRRVGCSFVDMHQSVRIRIQGFIVGLQREEIMRQRGLL
jgi:c-di-GMP-binding flagellar brake protein YcgR